MFYSIIYSRKDPSPKEFFINICFDTQMAMFEWSIVRK